jgi:hypothetical protein
MENADFAGRVACAISLMRHISISNVCFGAPAMSNPRENAVITRAGEAEIYNPTALTLAVASPIPALAPSPFAAAVAEKQSSSPYATAADFAKYAMKVRERQMS